MATRLLSALGIAIVAIVLWRSVFVVDQGDVALLTRFSETQSGDYGPGLHWKSPLDAVHRFDRRVITRSFQGEGFLSQDQKPLNVDFYVKWRLLDPARYFAATGGDEETAAARVADIVREHIRSALASAPLAADVAEMSVVGQALNGGALSAPSAQLGLELVDAQLQRIDLPDNLANAIYERMQQSLEAQAAQTRTQSSLESERIRADAERKRAQIMADATREAQRLRGAADAAAADAFASAYRANPEFAAFTHTLQAYKNSLGRDGDVLVISPEGEFFKYLHSASGR